MAAASLVAGTDSLAPFQPRALTRAPSPQDFRVRLAPASESPSSRRKRERWVPAGRWFRLRSRPTAATSHSSSRKPSSSLSSVVEAFRPDSTTETDLEASLADQLYRARLLEFRGLAIAVGPLAALAGTSGTLDLEDSAVLRFWCDVPNRQAVRLVFDAENALVGVYGPPRPLGEMLPSDVSSTNDADAKAGDDEGPIPAGELARALVVALTEPASTPSPAVDSDAAERPRQTLPTLRTLPSRTRTPR